MPPSPPKGWLRRLRETPLFILPRDFTLFLIGAKTDAAIHRVRATFGARAAFEAAYTNSPDPWASAAGRYNYQRLKYERIMAMLPQRRFAHALDLGSGLGLMTERLAAHADRVLGIDIAAAAIGLAEKRCQGLKNVSFAQGDVLDLPASLNGRFDLVVIADTLYYLSPLDDSRLKAISARVADLLMPGGICLLANHFFFSADPDSRLSRRIHHAFDWSPRFELLSRHRRAFFIVSILAAPVAGEAAIVAPAA